MHNYVQFGNNEIISTPTDDVDYKSEKTSGNLTIEQLQQQRDQDMASISHSRPPS